MKKFVRIFFSIMLVVIVLGVIFCIIDTLRVHGDEEPIFIFSHKIKDGVDYSAKVDIGLGYKIVRFSSPNEPEIIKVGTLFMSENSPFDNNDEEITLDEVTVVESGEDINSGDEVTKMTTFGEKYKDTIFLEGMEEEVYVENINSKIGYSMEYFYELFDYVGYEDHDKYVWNLASGDVGSTMTVYDITNEDAYKEAMENIEKKDLFEEISGEESTSIQKLYYRTFSENEIKKVNYIYIMWLDDLKLMVDLYLPLEAEEGVGSYMRKMVTTINKI